MGPLPAPVQPDGEQGRRGQQLHRQGDAPEGHIGAGQQPAVDHQHGRQLRKPPYMPLAAQGEHQHRQHPGAEIVGLQRLPQQIARPCGRQRRQGQGKAQPLLQGIRGPQCRRGNEERPQDILIPGVHRRSAEGQVKGHLRHHGADQQPQGVFFPVVGPVPPFGDLEGENREGQPSYPPEFRVLGEKGSRLAVSDAGVAILFAQAALEGASLNIFINTKMMKDQEEAERLNYLADQLIATGKELKETTYDAVLKGIRP